MAIRKNYLHDVIIFRMCAAAMPQVQHNFININRLAIQVVDSSHGYLILLFVMRNKLKPKI